MAGGKVHHWKHGWIPLDAFARKVVEEHRQKSAARRAEMANRKAWAKPLARGVASPADRVNRRTLAGR